jgi:hypothetical protein
MSDLRDFTGKNRKFTGTIGERISTGTTAERDTGTFGQATIRFNTTTSLMEYYDGNDWKSIDAPPLASSISPSTIASDGSTIFTITVSGSNFSQNCTARFIGADGTEYTPGTTTRVSSSSVTMTTLTSMTVTNEPYDIKITNVSGLFSILENALDAGSSPAFTAAAGSLGTLGDGGRAATNLTSQTFGPATDADGQQINYTITSGSISPGLRLGTPNDGNNGKIVGTATAVGSNTTSTFTIQASDGVNTASRQYSITVNAPVIETFTATGPGTFSVPAGVSTISILMVAGGGSGGSSLGGGGGGGGLLEGTLTVTPGSSIAYNVGAGATQSTSTDYYTGYYGSNTTFGPIPGPGSTATAIGGGFGTGHRGGPPHSFGDGSAPQQNSGPNVYNIGGTGGSGGGTGSSDGPATVARGGFGNQSASAGLTGYGFNGGAGGGSSAGPNGAHGGGGGGGAGGLGGDTNTHPSLSGSGGVGRISTLSGSPVYYAGGGGGCGHPPTGGSAAPGGLGGGTAGGSPGTRSTAGTTNRGGGSGCGGHPSGGGGAGGPGIIIVKY